MFGPFIKHKVYRKTVGFSGLRTLNAGVEGELADNDPKFTYFEQLFACKENCKSFYMEPPQISLFFNPSNKNPINMLTTYASLLCIKTYKCYR